MKNLSLPKKPKRFNPDHHNHVDRIKNAQPDQVIFFTKDERKLKDCTNGNFAWYNDGAYKLTPVAEPKCFKKFCKGKNNA